LTRFWFGKAPSGNWASLPRVFVDFVAEAFRRDRLAERFAGSLG